MLIQRNLNYLATLVFAFLTVATVETLSGQTTKASDETEDIVQAKNKVDLVNDANLGEAVGRRPDLDFSNVSVDQENSGGGDRDRGGGGSRGGGGLSAIPAEAFSKVEVLKAATPDLDAETRGSILRVDYKPNYELDGRLLQGRLYGRYKKLYYTTSPFGDITWGDRIGENAGFRITAEHREMDRGSDKIRYNWSDEKADSTGARYMERIDLPNERVRSDDIRLNSSFDYRFSEDNNIYLRYTYEEVDAYNISSAAQVSYDDVTLPDATSGATETGSVSREADEEGQLEENQLITLGGKSKLGFLDIEWRVQQSETSDEISSGEKVVYERDDVELGYTRANTAFPEVVFPADNNDASLYKLNRYDSYSSSQEGDSTIMAIDFKWQSKFLEDDDYLKFGFKDSVFDTSVVRATDVYSIATGESIPMDSYVSSIERNEFLGGDFSQAPMPDVLATSSYLDSNSSVLELDDEQTALRTFPASYGVQEDITAAYAMLNWQRDRLRLIGGFRFEDTALTSKGNAVTIQEDGSIEVDPVSADNAYSNIFPGLHAQYSLNSQINLFGSFTKTIKRPDPDDTAPYRTIETGELNIQEGNPRLKPTLFDSIDLALDYKPHDDLLVSWELFHREVTDSIFTDSQDELLDDVTYRLEVFRNGESATLQGSKVVVQQNLGQISPVLEPWSWNIAYTYTDSDASYAKRPDESLPVADVSENEIDTVITYQGEKLFVQLGIEYLSEQLYSVANPSVPDNIDDLAAVARAQAIARGKDVYVSDFLWYNMKVDYKFNDTVTGFIDYRNLAEANKEERTVGSSELPYYYQGNDSFIFAGMRFSL